MEVIKMMKKMMLLLMVVIVWMSNNNGAVVVAVNYTVGGDNGGWDQSTDLASWSSAQTFHPQDILIFQYTPNHNVLEVSAADFATCTTTNPLRPPQPPGTTRSVIPLTAAGSRYFVCGTLGHCVSGMKLQVNTVAAAGQQPPSSTPTVPRRHPPTPQLFYRSRRLLLGQLIPRDQRAVRFRQEQETRQPHLLHVVHWLRRQLRHPPIDST